MVSAQAQPTWVGQARRRDQTMGVIPYDLGLGIPEPFDLPNVGYLDELRLSSQVGFTTGAGAQAATDTRGINSSGLSRLTLTVNSIGTLFDCDGDMLAVISAIDDVYRTGSSKFLGSPSALTTTLAASTAYVDKWFTHIPLGLQLKNMPYPIGFFQTALQNLSIRLIARFLPVLAGIGGSGDNALSALYNNAAAAVVTAQSGQLQISEKFFDPIAAPSAQPYLGYIHRWTQWNVPLNGPGALRIPLPGQNYYTRLIYGVVAGTAGALALQGNSANYLQRLQLGYGSNYFPFDEDELHGEVTGRMRRQYGSLMDSLPAGYYTHDFVQDTHDNRDWINSAGTTNLASVLTFGTGGTYGAGSYVAMAVEEVAPLTLPAAASVQGNPSVAVGNVPGAG